MLQALQRRRFIAAMAGAVAAGRAWGARAAVPGEMTLMVAGPAGGEADRWADLLSPALARAMQGAAVSRQNVGGADGVTGANQFEGNAWPDGCTALLVPGLAALSWLVGDARVKFDAAHWIPVWGGTVASALASRVRLAPGQKVRFAVHNTAGPELAGLLALDLLGVQVIPVRANPAAPQARYADVDAVYLRGAALRTEAAALSAAGMGLAFGFGALDASGEAVRDPAFPNLPTAHEEIARARPDASPTMLAGLRALSAASQLDLALTLPQLSPAASVARWRRGCSVLARSGDVQAEASRTGLRPVDPAMAGSTVAAIATDVPVLLGLRRWLSERGQWRPV